MIRKTQFLLSVLSVLLCYSAGSFSMQQYTGSQNHADSPQALEDLFLQGNFDGVRQIVTRLFANNERILHFWCTLIDMVQRQGGTQHLQESVTQIVSLIEHEIGNVRAHIQTLAQEGNTLNTNLRAFNTRLEQIKRNLEDIERRRRLNQGQTLSENETNALLDGNAYIEEQAPRILEQRTQATHNADELKILLRHMNYLHPAINAFSVQLINNHIVNSTINNSVIILLDNINNLKQDLGSVNKI